MKLMINKLVLVFTLIISIKAAAQNTGTFCLQLGLGGTSTQASALFQAGDGSFFVAGDRGSFTPDRDFYLCKISASGTLLWSKTLGTPGVEYCNAICKADGGNIMLAGSAGSGLYLIKTDSSGNILSAKTYVGYGTPLAMVRTTDNGYAVAGYDFFVARFDSSMNPLWANIMVGGNNADAYSIVQTSDGGFAVGGHFSGGMGMVKQDSFGNLQWTKTAGGSMSEQGKAVIQTDNGDYILAGLTASWSGTHYNSYLVKFSSSGNLLWTKTFGSPTYEDGAYSLVKTYDGGYAMAGYYSPGSSTGIFVMKFDANDSLQWSTVTTSVLGAGIFFPYMIQTIDHGFAVVAQSVFAPAISLVKIDSMGNGCCMVPVTLPSGSTGTSGSAGTMSFFSTPTVISGGTDTIINFVTSLKCASTAITLPEQKEDEIFIFPNPSAGNFTIDFGYRAGNGTVELYNIFGQKLFEENSINESKKEISVKNILSGIYFVKVSDAKNNYCKKIIVE